MEDSLRIQRFQQLPSATEFASQIESRNVPAVFVGCVKGWEAVAKWNPSSGGLEYLEDRVGSFMVEAMVSRTAPVFYGDLRSHERVPLPFSTFIGFCKQHRQNVGNSCSFNSNSGGHQPGESDTEQGYSPFVDAAPQQMYLAQVPIINAENEDRVQLETLREDIQMPAILEEKNLSSVNLWMNNAQARSSAHYDPHNNLLCIVTGRKQVVLWPPSASPMLYPMPIYGEASNHSSVALENPDFSVHPRAKYSMQYSKKVILHAGDALFIPEGWFHQVDSDDFTIAVNYWWRSSIISSLADHMDAYYLRRILRRLTDREMDQVLLQGSTAMWRQERNISELPCKKDHEDHSLDQANLRKNLKGKEQQHSLLMLELKPYALQALHELVALVHDHVNASDQNQPVLSTSRDGLTCYVTDGQHKTLTTEIFHIEDDPVAKILWILEPGMFQDIFLAMAVSLHSPINIVTLSVCAWNFH
ncbi:2-oxoglutarate and Fe(II)-dependent oxygenase superfamily protein, putative isoform 2 [Theobroma cacao]|uniref:2-oxoglutarate and Fe(II)-dependent oxygenase superfamily protein, putative isoform 2 n=1 Tax=Theobroma cacao TaxID=3641 RepID=A0A061DQF2_THECC|nr:2-oxoglutarate and Fe(II)-dependent oxygenase superfamily protein, putative isoform 2 [Theobroma cacao]